MFIRVQATILSTGWALPDRVMTNDDLAQLVDTSDEWIYSHTGIKTRRIAAEHETTSDLGLRAARMALERGGLGVEQVDMILVATATPDYPSFPSTASLIQDRLGAAGAGAMDVSAACTGFVYALETARAFVSAGTARYVLVIGAEIFSRILNWKDRNTCVLFGDGAGAVLVGPSPDPARGLRFSRLRSDGSGAEALLRPAGGTKEPLSPQSDPTRGCLAMDGRRVYTFAVKAVREIIEETCADAGLIPSDLDWIVPHQANIRIIDAAAKRLELPLERFYTNIERLANTSGASIPLALAEMDQKGLLKPGQKVLTVGFGAGLTYGANLLVW